LETATRRRCSPSSAEPSCPSDNSGPQP
jgi:hypothetical protein